MTLTITDMGSMSGLAMFGYAWAMRDFECVSSDGYERTITYRGYEGYEKHNKSQKNGTMNVLVAERFIVTAEGSNIEMDAVKDALDRIDFEALEAMKDVGVSEAR